MTSAYGNPCIDPTANLPEQYKKAAASAGYGRPFINAEDEYAQRVAAQRAAQAQLPKPEVK